MKTPWYMVTFVFSMLILGPTEPRAQDLSESNVADPTDFRAGLINPALSSVHHSYLLMGTKLYHTGFLDGNSMGLNNAYINLSFSKVPGLNSGMNITVKNFSMPMYSRTSIGMGLSKGFFDRIFLGLKIDATLRSYDENEFDLVDPGDPVFADGSSKTSMSVGMGLVLQPLKKLTIGYSTQHLNRPCISFIGDDVTENIVHDGGLSYGFRDYRVSVGLTCVGSDFFPNGHIKSEYFEFVSLLLGYEYSGLRFGVHFHPSNRFDINYDFDYTLSEIKNHSYGSHQLNLVYHFGRPPEPPNIFDISVEDDSLFVLKQWFHLHNEMGALGEKIQSLQDFMPPDYEVTKRPDFSVPVFNEKWYSKDYLHLLQRISELLRYQSPLEVRLIGSDSSADKAAGIKKQITLLQPGAGANVKFYSNSMRPDSSVQNLNLVDEQTTNTVLHKQYISKDRATIRITSSNKMRADIWSLQILDSNDLIIKRFEGRRRVRSSFKWNWRDENGDLVQPGWYVAVFRWSDEKSGLSETRKVPIFISQRSQHIDILVTKTIERLDEKSGKIDILLKK